MLRKKQLSLSVKSIVKKRFRKAQSQKPRKKRKVAEEKIFYGFECLHCPEDEEGDTAVWSSRKGVDTKGKIHSKQRGVVAVARSYVTLLG